MPFNKHGTVLWLRSIHFNPTITSNRYVYTIKNFLVGKLTKFPQNVNFWFQQDRATHIKTHNTNINECYSTDFWKSYNFQKKKP